MTEQPQEFPPALAAIGGGFTADDSTRVLASRQPGDSLTATRVVPLPGGERFGVLGRMPMRPSAAHLGVMADISVAQGIRDGLGPGQAMRTLSLRVEELAPLRAGEALRGAGTLLSTRPDGIVARAVIVGEDDRPVAEALGRFMAVSGSGYTMDASAPTEAWGAVAVPEDWARAFRIGEHRRHDDGARLTLAPSPETGNNAGMMHGGVQMRLHELAAQLTLAEPGEADTARPVSLETTYHRPVPVGGEPLDVEVEIVRRGRRVAVTQTRVRGSQAKILSTAEIIWAG